MDVRTKVHMLVHHLEARKTTNTGRLAALVLGARLGLRMRAVDMARFGLLWLARGEWSGQRLLSTSWVDFATTRHSATTTAPAGGSTHTRAAACTASSPTAGRGGG